MVMLSSCIGMGENSEIKAMGEKNFPVMTGIDLLGEERILPKSFTGRFNLVAVAFEREQQEDVNTWIPVAEKLMQKHSSLKFYEIPLIYKMNAAMRGWINIGMRAVIEDKTSRERTITVYTDRDKFTSLMNMQTQSIYVLLLDDKGKIHWKHEGVTTEKAIQSLSRLLEEYTHAK